MANQGTIANYWMSEQVAHRATEQMIREHSKTFFFATALLPGKERRAIRSLYAFCRASDDLADCESTRIEDFERWRQEVALPALEQRNPLLFAWAMVREAYAVDRHYEQELLDGIRMDLQFHPKLGIALQLTNILRDIGEDLQRGRIYLPLEDLKRFHLTTRDIQNQVYDERFISLMQFEIQRARDLYAEAVPGIALLSPQARPAVGAAALLYQKILDEIEKLNYQVYTHRAYTSGLQKLVMLPSIFLKVAQLR